MPPQFGFHGKAVSGRFTIPSGIVTVTLDTLELLAREISALGILTTKSIGPVPRAGNPEPVFSQMRGGTFVNAVGLANPGCDEFASELAEVKLPEDKFLLISIFGGTPEDFQKVASTLAPYADGFELNFSCPHAEGYGQEIGTEAEIARDYFKAVKAVTDKPVMPKLSPNVGDLEPLAAALIEAGADGFTVINTSGPIEFKEPLTGEPAISNRVGGISGTEVKSEALRCISQVAEAIRKSGRELPILGMGGIQTAEDVRQFEAAGASFFGVGSALSGMDTCELKSTFTALEKGEDDTIEISPDLMQFKKFHVARVDRPAADLAILWTEENFQCEPGQFVFVWLPGDMEKPFAPAFDTPNALVARAVGPFTKALCKLEPGDAFYMRGPYGTQFDPLPDPAPDAYCLVGGGTGIAPLLLLAKRLSDHAPADRIHVFLGGRSANQIYFQEEFQQYAMLHIATDDGSAGFHGFVTQLLEKFLESRSEQTCQFYNCGPERMEKPAFEIQRRHPHTGIQTSVERYMKCGVGICGICAMDGLRTCVDGPVLSEAFIQCSNQFGRTHRTKTGELEPIE